MKNNKKRVRRKGPVAQKILLLLNAGFSLLTSAYPHQQFYVLKSAAREWEKINVRSLRKSISKLYQSRLVEIQDEKDGSVRMILSRAGKREVLRYKVEAMKIPTPTRWDGKWRFVMFDIPENLVMARNALREKLNQLGFYQYQRSVFVHPFPCENEVDFVIELFEVRPHVRMITASEIDNELHIKKHFGIS